MVASCVPSVAAELLKALLQTLLPGTVVLGEMMGDPNLPFPKWMDSFASHNGTFECAPKFKDLVP